MLYERQVPRNQNLTDVAVEIQRILEKLSTAYPTSTSKEKVMVVGEAVNQIESDPTFKSKVIDAVKMGGTEALKEIIDSPLINILVASIKEWLDTP